MDKVILRKWLKSGYVFHNKLYPTYEVLHKEVSFLRHLQYGAERHADNVVRMVQGKNGQELLQSQNKSCQIC